MAYLLKCCPFVLLLMMTSTAHSYVFCQTKVKEIYPNRTTGIVYFKFQDGTAIQSDESDSGCLETLQSHLPRSWLIRKFALLLTSARSAARIATRIGLTSSHFQKTNRPARRERCRSSPYTYSPTRLGALPAAMLSGRAVSWLNTCVGQ